jgi:hypothetical protein
MNYSPENIKHWHAYEKVRAQNKFNMFDPAARKATKLDRDNYLFVMKNFDELKVQALTESTT